MCFLHQATKIAFLFFNLTTALVLLNIYAQAYPHQQKESYITKLYRIYTFYLYHYLAFIRQLKQSYYPIIVKT